MAVLICGGAGYIGSHTAICLMGHGRETVVYDSLVKGHRKAVKGGNFMQGDIRDRQRLSEAFRKYEIEAVINFAAYIEAGESVRDPLKYYENNVCGCVSLLAAMKEAGVSLMVFSSSAAIYGDPCNVPVTEEERMLPVSPYGETKAAVEKMLSWADRAYGIKHTALRYFNAAGAHESGELGEDHDPETHLIPMVLLNALGLKDGLRIFGNDYNTADGTCERDYVHVSDLAEAHYLALLRLESGRESSAYNLGNENAFSNMQILRAAEEVTGSRIPYTVTGRREGDPGILVASSEKAKRELGWKPIYTDINEIIAAAWKWHKGHPEGYED